VVREEGPRALYNGLAAGLQRQMCFASVRIGGYDVMKSKYKLLFYKGIYFTKVICKKINFCYIIIGF